MATQQKISGRFASSADKAVQKVIDLGALLLQFGRVKRATFYEDGKTPESVTDHTVMATIVSCAFAEQFFPELDIGKIAQFAAVHDLVEVYAGDTTTLVELSAEGKKNKEARERRALEQIQAQFGDIFPWIVRTIEEYETLSTPEARFVKTVDKLLPKITHVLNRGSAIKRQNQSRNEILRRYSAQHEELAAGYGRQFPEVLELRKKLVEEVCRRVWPDDADLT